MGVFFFMEKDNEIEILKEINQNTKMGMDSLSTIIKKYIIRFC